MAAYSSRPHILDLADEPEESFKVLPCGQFKALLIHLTSGPKLEIFEKEWNTHREALTYHEKLNKNPSKIIKLRHLVQPGLDLGGVAPNPRHLKTVGQRRLRQFRIVAQLS